jgi:hypothetical protein
MNKLDEEEFMNKKNEILMKYDDSGKYKSEQTEPTFDSENTPIVGYKETFSNYFSEYLKKAQEGTKYLAQEGGKLLAEEGSKIQTLYYQEGEKLPSSLKTYIKELPTKITKIINEDDEIPKNTEKKISSNNRKPPPKPVDNLEIKE